MNGLERRTAVVRLDAGPVEYRLEGQSADTVIVFHGGHMRAALALGEDVFTALGYSVLVPSRPGYGQTPLGTGTSPSGFADVTRELCRHLEIEDIAAVVGISAGGRTAVTMAARHPDFVRRLVLESAVGFVPWPDRLTRFVASLAFTAATEKATWGAVRALMRVAPKFGVRSLLGGMTTEPVGRVMAGLDDEGYAALVALFSQMRSGHGFINDLGDAPDATSEVTQPTLVIASRKDGSVPFAQAESLVAGIQGAELVVSQSASHFVWYADDYAAIADKIQDFLTSVPLPPA